jgi:hypothetical protein
MAATEQLSAALSAIPEVQRRRSRFGWNSNSWWISDLEFAHLHSPTMLDLRLPHKLQTALRGDPRAHFRQNRSDWIELEFHNMDDVEDIVELAREVVSAHTMSP